MSQWLVRTVLTATMGLAVILSGAPPLAADDGDGDNERTVCAGQSGVAGPVCVEIESVVTDLLP